MNAILTENVENPRNIAQIARQRDRNRARETEVCHPDRLTGEEEEITKRTTYGLLEILRRLGCGEKLKLFIISRFTALPKGSATVTESYASAGHRIDGGPLVKFTGNPADPDTIRARDLATNRVRENKAFIARSGVEMMKVTPGGQRIDATGKVTTYSAVWDLTGLLTEWAAVRADAETYRALWEGDEWKRAIDKACDGRYGRLDVPAQPKAKVPLHPDRHAVAAIGDLLAVHESCGERGIDSLQYLMRLSRAFTYIFDERQDGPAWPVRARELWEWTGSPTAVFTDEGEAAQTPSVISTDRVEPSELPEETTLLAAELPEEETAAQSDELPEEETPSVISTDRVEPEAVQTLPDFSQVPILEEEGSNFDPDHSPPTAPEQDKSGTHTPSSDAGVCSILADPLPSPERGLFPVSTVPDRLKIALAALAAFRSVGADRFGVSLIDDTEPDALKANRFWEVMRADTFAAELPELLARQERESLSLIARIYGPKFGGPTDVFQIDDCTVSEVAWLQPYSFLTIETSRGSCQCWLAGIDASCAKRLFAFFEANHWSANNGGNGSVRFPGSFNCKPQHRTPDGVYPVVRNAKVNAGFRTSPVALAKAGLLAPIPAPQLATPSPFRPTLRTDKWPDYQRCLDAAPRHAETLATGKPDPRAGEADRHVADWHWCLRALGRGHSASAVRDELVKVSDRAAERGPAYVNLTVAKAETEVLARRALAPVTLRAVSHMRVP